jgi:hypothetical protein
MDLQAKVESIDDLLDLLDDMRPANLGRIVTAVNISP